MFEQELQLMIEAARRAASEIVKIYKSGFDVMIKEDRSPVTTADLRSNKIIRETLSVFKDTAWLSEEDKDDMTRLSKRKLFIIDPLDGTQDFVNRDDSFSINIALIVDKRPVVSVIAIPMEGSITYAKKNEGAFYMDRDGKVERIHTSSKLDNLIVCETKTHSSDKEEYFFKKNRDKIDKIIYSGASTKAVKIARGEGDICVRFSSETKEWDVAASDLIISEASGIMVDPDKKPFIYNREDVYNKKGYCIFNREENLKLL